MRPTHKTFGFALITATLACGLPACGSGLLYTIAQDSPSNTDASTSGSGTGSGSGDGTLNIGSGSGSGTSNPNNGGSSIPLGTGSGNGVYLPGTGNVGPRVPVVVSPNDLVVNGSFEDPALPPGNYAYIPSGVHGWNSVVSFGHKIEVQNRVAGAPYDGDQHCELDSDGASGIYQYIPTTPGAYYQISFYYSSRPGTGLHQNGLTLLWDGQDAADIDMGIGGSATAWVSFTTTLTASTTSTPLEFDYVGISDTLGSYIDDVVVIQVPPPSRRPVGG